MKKIIITLLLCFLSLGAFGFSYAQDVNKNLSKQLIRLHIIANSDTPYDQDLKLKTKDHIACYIKELTKEAATKSQAEDLIKSHLNDIQDKTNDFLKTQKAPYGAAVQYGRYEFPTKSYQNITLPGGQYDGLQIQLGNADGKNWWCVMYPPLCFTSDVSAFMPEDSVDQLKNNLTKKDYSIIAYETEDSIPIQYKFKIVEFFENLRQSTLSNVYSH